MVFSKGENVDINSLKEIWLSSFSDTKEGCDLFFDKMFSSDICCTAKEDNKIVAALYLLPATFLGFRCHYLYGAATHPDYRGRGIMKKLLRFSAEQAKADGDCFSFLLPSSDSLYDFYKKSGYVDCCAISTVTVPRSSLENNLTQEISILQLYVSRDKSYINYGFEFNEIYGGANFVSNDEYVVVSAVQENTAEVTSLKINGNSTLLKNAADCISAEYFSFRLPPDVTSFLNYPTTQRKFGMVLPLTDEGKTIIDNINRENKKIYLDFTLD